MQRRTFLRSSALGLGAAVLSGSSPSASRRVLSPSQEAPGMAFAHPELPYKHDALEPHIDKMTMEIHHGKHHAAYVANLNKAIEGTPNASTSLEELLSGISKPPPQAR